MNRAHGNVTGHSYLYIFIVLFLIRIQTVSIKQIIILIIKTGNHFYDLIFHLQISVRLDIPDPNRVRKSTVPRTGLPDSHISWKKTFEHAHVQCLAKTARTRDQRHLRTGLPPFPDKIRLVNIERTLFPKFVKPLYTYIYHRLLIHTYTSRNAWMHPLMVVYMISSF